MKNILLSGLIMVGFILAPMAHAVNYVNTVWSVDAAKKIDWGGSTKYSVAWLAGIATWNTQTPIVIQKDTLFTVEDLTVKDVSKTDLWLGRWTNSIFADKIELNKYWLDMVGYGSIEEQHVSTHELGHALGLLHSLPGNVMRNDDVYTTIILGAQDKLDYDFLW